MSSGDAADLDGNPAELTPGPRDHLITRSLRARLNEIGEEFRDEEQLDPAEGPNRLARHAMREIERDLDADASAETQARRVNGLLRDLISDQDSLGCRRGRAPAAGAERHQGPVAARVTRFRSRHCRRPRSARATCSSMPRASRTLGPSFEPNWRRADSVDLHLCLRHLVGRPAPPRRAR